MKFSKEVYQQALNDLKRLKKELEMYYSSSLDDLCERLNGFHLRVDGEMFDCNFGLLTVTVESKEDGEGYRIQSLLDINHPDSNCWEMETLRINELKNLVM